MKIYFENYVEDATLVPSSAALNQDISRLKEPRLSSTFEFTGDADETITISFSIPRTIGAVIIDRGNMSETAVVVLEGNTSDVWTSPAFSTNLTRTDTMHYADVDEAYQYWRLVFNDVGTGGIRVGYLYIGGEYLRLPGYDPNVSFQYNTTSERSFSVSGQVFGNRGYEYLELPITFPDIPESQRLIPGLDEPCAGRQEMLYWWRIVENVQPFWIIPVVARIDEFPPFFAVLDGGITFTHTKDLWYTCDLEFRQVF